MPSIRDVAQLAQVSTGTVSKYLNQTGYIHPNKRHAIAQAIETLGYAPNHSARTLKTSHSKDILCLVPNMNERLYREITESVTAVLGEQYRLILQFTNDDSARETQFLLEYMNNSCAGVLLITCQPQNHALFEKLLARMPIVFLMRQPELTHPHSFIGFHHFDAIYALLSELIALDFEKFALFTDDDTYSSESDCIRALHTALQHHQLPQTDSVIVSAPFRKESAFRSIMRLLDQPDFPRAIVCSQAQIAQAICDVASFRNLTLGRDLFLFTLGEDSWYHSIFRSRVLATYRDMRKLGTIATQTLLEHIGAPMVIEPVHIKLRDDFDFSKVVPFVHRMEQNLPTYIASKPARTLSLLFNQADAGTDALRSLLPQFTQAYDTAIEIQTLSHDDLYHTLCAQKQPFDLCAVDAPWVPYLASRGILSDLTDRVQHSAIPANLSPFTLSRTSSFDGKIYGIPHTYSLQLLYYRKDFFQNPALATAFYEQYHVPLAPPQNWHMFQLISQFFATHPTSPCAHGTSVYTGTCPSALCCDLYPRMTAYNGGIFDSRGYVQLYRPENIKAFESLLHCLPYAVWQKDDYLHLDNMNLLLEGQIAMCVAFSNNAGFLLDNSNISLRNKIGFAPIPARQPVVSGWSTCMHAHSTQQEQAWNFIQWFAGMDIASAYTILGGASPLSSLLEQQSLVQMYPWNSLARQEYHSAIPRSVPPIRGARTLDFAIVESMLAEVMHRAIAGTMPLRTALLSAHQQLCVYAESQGYPQNIRLEDDFIGNLTH